MSTESVTPEKPTEPAEKGFDRILGSRETLAVAFGAMIGFGWIVLTGGFLADAGTLGAALALVIGGFVVLLVGLTYAELVSAMPDAGGEHNYALRALGSRASFVTSWSLVLGYVSVVAFEAVALPQSLLYLFPDMLVGNMWTVAGYDVYASWVAVGVVSAAVITAINYVGIRPAAIFQSIAVLFLLAVGAALLLGSFAGGSVEQMDPLFTGGVGGVLAVLVAAPFLFVGFDVIPQSAAELKVPHRKIGLLLIVSVVMAVAWYVLIMLTIGSSLPAEELAASDLAAADGMSALWGSDTMGTVLVLGGLAGILTSWNGFLIGASRLVYAMGHSGMLPAWFGHIHPRFRTPGNAVLFIGALSIVAPFFGRESLVWLVDAGGLTIVISYAMVALSFVVLRIREPGMERPFRTPLGLGVGILATGLSVAIGVLYLPGMTAALVWPYEWAIFGVWWLIGLVFLFKVRPVGPGPDAANLLLETRSK